MDTHLLHLGGGALEELDVARADHLTMLRQRNRRVVVVCEEDEGVAGGASVGLVHEQHAVLAVQHLAWRQLLVVPEELELQPTPQRARYVQTGTPCHRDVIAHDRQAGRTFRCAQEQRLITSGEF